MAMATQQLADELATMKERAAAIGRYRLDVAAQTRAMDRVAELALKLAVRMPGMNGHQQAGVLKILGARVVLLDNSRHPEFYIDGVAAGQRLYSAVAAPDGYPSAPARPRDASATTSDGDRCSIEA
jgi:hypothetical protein